MIEEQLLLYHTGYSEIREPDVHYGRKNADFGQGFYLSPDRDFSYRWARIRKGEDQGFEGRRPYFYI